MLRKGKGKKSQHVELDRPIKQSESDAESELDLWHADGNIQPGDDMVIAPSVEWDDIVRRHEVEEKIAQFFEDRPYFYDLSHELYKNKRRRDSELAELAGALGPRWDGKAVWTRFKSIRTDYGKLRRDRGKSSQGAKKLTSLQKWKMHRYSFLDAYMKVRGREEELGKEFIMPKKGKGKKSQHVEPDPPIKQSESDAESESELDLWHADRNIQPQNDMVVALSVEWDDIVGRHEVEEKIAQFFEDRPYFYDLSHELYKNKRRRDSELAELAGALGPKWDGKAVWTRFKSIRTDYGKLRRDRGKSSQGAKKLTSLQKWKMHRYSFLDAYMKIRNREEELGKLPPVASDRSDEEDAESVDMGQDDSSLSSEVSLKRSNSVDSNTQPQPKYKKSKKVASEEVARILSELLTSSKSDEMEISKTVKSLSEPSDSRQAWAAWLSSSCHEIPDRHFREFQQASFNLVMSFMGTAPSSSPTSATVTTADSSQSTILH